MQVTSSTNGKPKNYARVFESFGVCFGAANGSDEALGDACPWCGKDRFYLNVTTGLVSKWERGEKHPQGPSLKLLALVQKKGLEAIA